MNLKRSRYITRTSTFLESGDVLVDVCPLYLRMLYVRLGSGLTIGTGSMNVVVSDSKTPVATALSTTTDVQFIYSSSVMQGGTFAWEPPECERVDIPGGSLSLGPLFEQGLRVTVMDDAGAVIAGTSVMHLYIEYVKKV